MFHRPVKASHRLFFALRPPIVQARQIAHAAPWLEIDGTPVAPDRLHITMFILEDRFDVPPRLAEALRGVGAAISAAPIRIELDRVGGGDRSIALRPSHRIAALDVLHDQLARRCATAGIAEMPDYTFSPHMTLGYRRGRPSASRIAPIVWTARELVLIHSPLGRTRHERLGAWPLAAAEPQLDLFGRA